jgi:ammonium transporter, Amt family
MDGYSLNTLYFLVSAVLVMWMAAGFTMLEAGSVRSKNVTEILIKNVALYSVASLTFLGIGYELMYGGWNAPEDHALMSDFFFQVVFVATAMSVVSGAVAERKKLWSFLAFAGIFTAFIYPYQGSWSWGGGWLSEAGFFDFAGSGIVHMAGAAAALAAVLLIGPRKGKYIDGKAQPIHGSSTTQVALGTLILWMGWFGFNGGSQLSIIGVENANAVAQIFVNTNTAAAAGLLAAMVYSKLWLKKTVLNVTLNGALAGLVVITADPLTPSPEMAMLYGAIGGLIVPISMSLLEKWGIDDPVGAISVHGVAGIIGLMLVPILNTGATFEGQLIGTGAIFGFVFGTSLVVWYILQKTIGLRVGEEEELAGSDMWETGSSAYPEFMEDKR